MIAQEPTSEQMLTKIIASWSNVLVETYPPHKNVRVTCDGPMKGSRYILSGNANCPFEFSNFLTRDEAIRKAYVATIERDKS